MLRIIVSESEGDEFFSLPFVCLFGVIDCARVKETLTDDVD